MIYTILKKEWEKVFFKIRKYWNMSLTKQRWKEEQKKKQNLGLDSSYIRLKVEYQLWAIVKLLLVITKKKFFEIERFIIN